MKKEITIDGKLYRLVEEVISPKHGRWYKCKNLDIFSLYNKEEFTLKGFTKGKWSDNTSTKYNFIRDFDPANVKEVEELLIKHAESIGLVDGVEYLSPMGVLGRRLKYPLKMSGSYLIDFNDCIIFNGYACKWAKPVRKPLFVNSYGTKFYEGDTVYLGRKESDGIMYNSIGVLSKDYRKQDEHTTELMTKEQYYKWLADNCKE